MHSSGDRDPSLRSGLKTKCLLQILDQIIRMFQSNRQSQQIRRALRGRAFDRGAMLDQAVRSPQTGCVCEDLDRGADFECLGLAALYLDREHAAEGRHLRGGDLMSGMTRKTRVVYGFDLGLAAEEFGNALRVLGMSAD